ncbi:PPR repeat-containing protein, putative [Eimeria tenella]|uniref:PPR repeat-containing protein, putative n=1 Tax=Eimeria tenella TaxID=5802 RepID=U6KQJ4_EIMTE|nr:PPR repeat-containing protein, putative [Eimeria tenella]CDJ37708.1 PPR repeat-containing protein, putative [Eimeria tenella]|eukprot:XP_013228546.1 PPR repeat-containing protein, putative [Eimeria tenella]
MAAQGVEINTVTYNSLLDVCARVGAMDRAASLLDDMLQKGVQPDLITFSTIIKGYCAHGQMDKGLLLLKAMKQKNINPDGVLYNSLLDGCVRSGYRAAYNVLQIMRREGVAADSKTVSTIVFGCLKGRMHAQAVEVVLNALETLRDANSRGPGRHPPRGRHANVGTNRKQDLPAIDEKTVRLLVYHLREQHMHHECTLVLDTAVSVGLMNRATAQSLLSGEGASGRRNPVISSAAPSGAFAPPQPLSRQQHVLANSPPVGACLTGIRGGQQQTNSHWNEARGVRRLPSGRQGGPAHRSSQGGAKEGQLFPAEGYLRFSTTQENTIGSVQPWYIDPPPSQTLSPDPVRPQAVNTLHSGAEGKQRPLTSHLQDPLQFHTAGLLGDLPMQHLLHLPINGSILTGGNAGDLSTSIAPSGQTLTLGASPYLTEEGISTQGAKLHSSLSVDLYGPGKVSESSCIWGAPAPGDTTPSATGCGLLAMPSAVACPPPHAVEVPSNSNALLGAGGPFFNEDYHLSELPLSSPGFPCEGSLQPSCTTAPLFQ